MAEVSTSGARPFCYRCHKPRVTCICERIPRVTNRTHIRLVQHPRERFHPIGTARIARLGLENVALEVVHPRYGSRPASLASDAALLYPGGEAADLASLASADRPSALVVVDGTWSHARTLFRDHGWLRRLPRLSLRPPESRYRLRREPAVGCVSTIEAIVEALRILEPETAGLNELLHSFEQMIDDQLAIIALRSAGKRRPSTPAWRRGHAGILAHEPERLVVVAGEAAPRDPAAPRGERRILQWAAVRLVTGERFEGFVCPPGPRFPSACHLAHMGLDAELVAAGSTPAALREAWQAFLRPQDVVVSWSQSTLSLLGDCRGAAEAIQLKSLYCSRNREPCGTLAELVARLALPVARSDLSGPIGPPPWLHGRAAGTLAEMIALLHHLRALAQGRS